MTKEIDNITDIGKMPESNEFQRTDQSSKDKTGKQYLENTSNMPLNFAQTVKSIFANHSEKIFTLTALVGYIFVFNSNRIQDLDDVFRYSIFLVVVIAFYTILLSGKSCCDYILSSTTAFWQVTKKLIKKISDKIKKLNKF